MTNRVFYSNPSNPLAANTLDVGEDTFPREFAFAVTVSLGSGVLRIVFFTALKTEVCSQVRVYSGGTAAAATPTLCRIGVWEVDASGNGSLVAATANDTTLFAATQTAYTRSFEAPFTKVAGRRYAAAPLVVTATTAPTAVGNAVPNVITSDAPRIGAVLVGQTDLPASFTNASLATNGSIPYMALLP